LLPTTYSTPAIGHVVEDDASSCITKNTGGGGETQNPAFVVQSLAFGMDGDVVGTGAIGTITSREGDITDTAHAIAQPVTYDFFNITAPVNRQNRQPGNPCHTLARSNAEHAVVMQPVGFDAYNNAVTGDVAKTLDVGQDHHHVPNVFQPAIAWDEELNASVEQAGTLLRGGQGGRHDGVLAPTLTASNNPSRSPQSSEVTQQVWAVMQATQPVAMRESGQGYWMQDEIAGTIDANMGMSGHANRPAVIKQQAMQVRRLTPVECERLQGFPDNYTAISWRGKSVDNCPDGPRYKALGNSWAVPVVRWIGRRIEGCRRNPTD
jgi:site-specific DNA-cytosine methylase